ncbi:HPP family protein [Thermodesulfitimonas sp.]
MSQETASPLHHELTVQEKPQEVGSQATAVKRNHFPGPAVKNYLLQSLFATLVVFVVLLLLSLEHAVIIASLGASTFIVFAMPQSVTARPRNVRGGHLVGTLSGCLCALIPHAAGLSAILVCALAVGTSIFVMVLTGTEHPPASGTALGFALTGFAPSGVLAIVTSAAVLSLVHYFFKPHLRDPT